MKTIKKFFLFVSLSCLLVACNNSVQNGTLIGKALSLHTVQNKMMTDETPVNGQNLYTTVTLSTKGTINLPDGGYPFRMYLSADNTLSMTEDVLLKTNPNTIESSSFSQDTNEWSLYTFCQIPNSTAAGTWYVFFVGDPDQIVSNNALADRTASTTITVKKFESKGAFKVYNSWGDSWDPNISGGYYYLPFEKIIGVGNYAYFYDNNYNAYQPRMVAKFKIDSGTSPMQNFTTQFQLGDDTTKTIPFIIDIDEEDKQNRLPYASFPDEIITYDLTDFINKGMADGNTIKLSVTGISGNTASISSFSIEIYDNGYDETPTDTYTSSDTGSSTASVVVSAIPTSPPIVRSISNASSSYTTRSLTEAEKQEIEDSLPEESVITNGHGTGLVKAGSLSAYDNVRLAVPLTSGTKDLSGLDLTGHATKDLSDSQYFPPYGDQGSVGSCASWSTAYYIMTYEMARENDYDLSGLTWDSTNKTPSGKTDQIMSPAFTYHLTNKGTNGGNAIFLFQCLSLMGCCTWDKMPNKDIYEADSPTGTKKAFSMPSEEAFEEAVRYRLADVPSEYFLSLKDSSCITPLLNSIDAGRCVSFVLKSDSLYLLFNTNGVMVGTYEYADYKFDHAQTIVGYVIGDAYTTLLTTP